MKLSVISISKPPKYLKMLPPERPDYGLKCVKIVGGWGFAPDPTAGAYSTPPDPLAGLRVDASRQETPLRGIRREGLIFLLPEPFCSADNRDLRLI
jgi:hypothetical protein